MNKKREKEFVDSFNKPNEAIKYFEQLLKSPRSNRDMARLGYIRNEEGESSKTIEERSIKGKNYKPTCHYYGKNGHTSNVCRSKNANENVKKNSMTYCQKCKKQGHQKHDCWTKITKTPKFEGHCYNCQKYGHREFECRSKPTWTSNKVRSYDNCYNWD